MTERNAYTHLLHKGESVLWEGRTEQGRFMPRRMGLFLLMLALVFAPCDGRSWGSFFTAIWSCSAFIIAGYVAMAVQTHRRSKREAYLVTDRRVMLLVPESTGLRLQHVKLLRNAHSIRIQREGKAAPPSTSARRRSLSISTCCSSRMARRLQS